MSPKAWQDPETTVEVYQAEVFGEEEIKQPGVPDPEFLNKD
jgi:AMMECR1 domain-containing protein